MVAGSGREIMKLDESGEVVEFTSVSPYYEREEIGQKGNTVRILQGEEKDKFINAIFYLNTVRIVNPETEESFKKLITDISMFRYNSFDIFIISWDGGRD
jgi:hypothetical protein